MKRIVMGALVLALAVGAAACGHENEPVEQATAAAPPAKTEKTPPPAPPEPEPEPESDDCNDLGINAQGLNEGACTDPDGTKYKVINRAHKLMLNEVGVRLVGIGATETIEVPYDTPLTGSFVVATVEVTNRMDAPVDIDGSEMFELGLGKKQFTADFDAMNTGSDDGLIYETMQPGQTVTGDVVFRVAPKQIGELEKTGNFVVYQFSDVDSWEAPVKRVGIVRTYN